MLVLVTGASSGIGLDTARALTSRGHAVVVHHRGRSQLGNVQDAATSWHGVVYGDLGVFDQIKDVAEQATAFGKFDAIIHNAGTVHSSDVFTVNTVAPYVLTALIERPTRLVYLSSSMHAAGSTDLRKIDRDQVTYSDSKLYVTALAAAFATRWSGTVSHAVDPGWVPTRMGGPGAPDDLQAGHLTQVWLATSDVVRPASGGYWYHREAIRPHPATQDPQFQGSLVRALERLTGIGLP